MKIIGIGGLLGLIAGIGAAEWLANESNAAYYSVVTFGALVGSAISKFFFGKADTSDD